jgi:hypothetical protein
MKPRLFLWRWRGRAPFGSAFWLCLFPLAACTNEVEKPTPPLAEVAEVAVPSVAPASLLHDAAALKAALSRLTGPQVLPIRALALRIYPDRVLLQLQDPAQPLAVQQYRFKAGEVLGPTPVRLTGPGELKDNLFPLKYADLEVIPRLVKQAERRTALPDARALSLTLSRNLPGSMDIRFVVQVESAGGKRRVSARKDGRILAVELLP